MDADTLRNAIWSSELEQHSVGVNATTKTITMLTVSFKELTGEMLVWCSMMWMQSYRISIILVYNIVYNILRVEYSSHEIILLFTQWVVYLFHKYNGPTNVIRCAVCVGLGLVDSSFRRFLWRRSLLKNWPRLTRILWSAWCNVSLSAVGCVTVDVKVTLKELSSAFSSSHWLDSLFLACWVQTTPWQSPEPEA